MTTFCPMLQWRPMRAPAITCVKCQIFVPWPISQPSSTYDDSWAKKSDNREGLGMGFAACGPDDRLSNLRGQLHRRPRIGDAEAAAGEHLLVHTRVQIPEAVAELDLLAVDRDRSKRGLHPG